MPQRKVASVKRLLVVGITTAGLMLGTAASTAAATAAVPGSRTAPVTLTHRHVAGLATPQSGGFFVCYNWNVGQVCVDATGTGYNARYYNYTGNTYLVDFNLVSDGGVRVGDQGAFWAGPGSVHTYFFATGNLGCARVFLYARQLGWQIYSPDDCP